MIFAAFPLAEALGAVLAHSHRLPDRMLRKGFLLDEPALAALRAAGHTEVIAAKLEPGDVAENEAAARLAAALGAPGLAAGRAGTGRVNLHAQSAGLLRVDASRVDFFNVQHEALTVATLPDYSVVAARDMVATIKVIPFAVPGAVLDRVEAASREGGGAFSLHPFRPLQVGLALSELPGPQASVTDGTIEATRQRVVGLGGSLLTPLTCPHETDAIAAAVRQLLAAGAELVLVAGASATVDRRDVGPEGVVRAGGEIVHFGMPVDPGNLICVARVGDIPALVLPGCARSPKGQRHRPGCYNGSLQACRSGRARSCAWASAACSRTPTCARCPAPRPPPRRARSRSGRRSRRWCSPPASRRGWHRTTSCWSPTAPASRWSVASSTMFSSSRARPIVVVTGHHAEEIRAALGNRPLSFVHAEDFASGLSASLKSGIAALPETAAAALVCLGDMPLVTGRMLDRLIDAWDPDEGRAIVVPTHQGRIGNPILWSRAFFREIMELDGDVGARSLLRRHEELVAEVDIGDDAVLRDFDTVDSLAGLPQHLRPAGLQV